MMDNEGGSPGGDWFPAAQRTNGLPQERVYRIAYPGFIDPGMSGTDREPSLQDLLKILREHWKVIGLTVATFFGLALFYCLLATKTYTAGATLEIGGYDPVLPGSDVEMLIGHKSKQLEYVKTQIAKLNRLSVADEVLSRDTLAEDLKAYYTSQAGWLSGIRSSIMGFIASLLPSSEEGGGGSSDRHYQHDKGFLQGYLSLVSIHPIEETNLVEIAVTTGDPKLSQRIANAHAEGFIDHLRKERHTSTLANLRFLQTQADELQDKVAAAEANLAKYAEQNELVALTKDQNLVVAQIGELSNLLAQATAARIHSESVVKGLDDAKDGAVFQGLDDHSSQVLLVSLKEAEAEYANLSQRLMPAHPQMVALQAKISSLKSTIAEQRKKAFGNLRAKYRSDLEAEKRLMAQIEDQKLKAHETSKRQVRYNILEREYESLKDLYQTVLRQLKEAQIASASSGTNISITDYAALPLNPSGPMYSLILTLALICGLGVGTGIALGLHLMDNTIKTGDDVQEVLALPSLGMVPSFNRPDPAPSQPELNGNGAHHPAHIGSNGHGSVPARQLFALTFPQAMVSEAFRTIRTSLLFSSADRPPRIVMVTSAKKGEGKTTFVSNLAISLAQASHRTLLIDADIRQARVHERFNIPPEKPGLADYLAGQAQLAEVISETTVHNLEVIAAGSAAPNPAELVGSEKMAQLIEILGLRYDYILVDSPPILPVADSLIMSRAVDGVILVVRSGDTEKQLAQEASRRLQRVHATILGVVLNDVNVAKEFRGYGEAYGYAAPTLEKRRATA